MAINTYFNMVRLNSHIMSFKDMWPTYQACIRFVINDFIPGIEPKFDLKPNFDDKMENMNNHRKLNWDTVSVNPGDIETTVLVNLMASLKNIRYDIPFDKKQDDIVAKKNNMERDSYRGEMEMKMCFALCYPSYPVIVDSPFYRIVKEYIEGYYDKFDVVEDIKCYLPLFGINESHHLRTFVREKLDEEETFYLNDTEQAPS